MPSASGKPTAVHFTLIFFVMLSVILGVVSYLFYNEADKKAEDYTARKKELDERDAQVRRMIAETDALKQLVGYEGFEVGLDEDDDTTKLVGAMRRDIALYANPAQGVTNYAAALRTLSEEATELRKNSSDRQATINQKDQELQDTIARKDQQIATHQKAASDAQEELKQVQQERDEALAAKDRDINQLRTDLSRVNQELTAEKEAHLKDVQNLQQEVAKLVLANERLNEQLADATKQSFEVADGEVRIVDHNSNLVWINLGEIDGLQPRVSFSVYSKDNRGIGRDAEDIKGSIEITRVVGPHLAQARILSSDASRPIAKGDPIYTPLWSPGRTERFSFVGAIDIDNDGRSDRTMLHDLISQAGAKIDNEVDDEGNRSGTGLTVHTKFLVIGELPDPASTADLEERKMYETVLEHYKNMLQEARIQGVRRVRLNDFLDYMGYKPQRRLIRPGEGTGPSARSRRPGSSNTAGLSP